MPLNFPGLNQPPQKPEPPKQPPAQPPKLPRPPKRPPVFHCPACGRG